MQFLYGVTTLRDTWNVNRGAAKQWNSRQRRNFMNFQCQTHHRLQYFRKCQVIEISVPWTTVAWDRITFLCGNARPSYFQMVKSKHIATEWAGGIPKVNCFCLRKSGPKTASAWIVQAQSCEQLPLLMQFLYGVTTLRDIWHCGTLRMAEGRVRSTLHVLSLIHIWRCRRLLTCRSRWSPYH